MNREKYLEEQVEILTEEKRELMEALTWAIARINRVELGHGWSAASIKYDEIHSLLARVNAKEE